MNDVTLVVNGERHDLSVEPRMHLADCLRDTLLLTGTHLGCEHGVCGACTLMADGVPVRSCLTLAATCDGAVIQTIEGFDGDALMAALRASFKRHHALQCGYCTPGMLVTAYDIVRRLPHADEARVRLELAGNLCRCTGYAGIVAAILDVLRTPPVADVQPVARGPSRPVTLVPPSAAEPPAMPSPRGGDWHGGVTLTRSARLAMPLSQAWPLLRSVRDVAGFVPGAAITSIDGDNVRGTVTAALGPIRTSFDGEAVVTYDDAAKSGRFEAAGRDRWTRSAVAGLLVFSVRPDGDGCVLDAEITYRLNGPLAQFGRPGVVSGVVDQMLAQFVAGMTGATTQTTLSVWGMIKAMLRKALSR